MYAFVVGVGCHKDIIRYTKYFASYDINLWFIQYCFMSRQVNKMLNLYECVYMNMLLGGNDFAHKLYLIEFRCSFAHKIVLNRISL